MDHVSDIKKLVRILVSSQKLHLLIIHGPPGWAKSRTVSQVLHELGIDYDTIGSYSTPLGLFNKLVQSKDKLVLADDTTGLLTSPLMVSLLCAATWSGGEVAGTRRVRWTSTSERAIAEFVDFSGKIIILTNSVPTTSQAQALVNRALMFKMEIAPESVARRFQTAALSAQHFPKQDIALEVGRFLTESPQRFDLSNVSLRTLEQGYEMAFHDPQGWRELLIKLLPKNPQEESSEEALVKELGQSGAKVQEQVAIFCRKTGKSRRTFFNLRGRLGLKMLTKERINQDQEPSLERTS